MVKKILSVSVRYLIGAAIIVWLLNADLINPDIIHTITPNLVYQAAALVILQILTAAWRVKMLLNAHNIHASLWRCLCYNSLGIFYSLFLPGGMSGDLARAYSFWRAYPNVSKSGLLGALFVDRLLGTASMVFIGLIAGTMLMAKLGLTEFVVISWTCVLVLCGGYVLLMRLHLIGDKTQTGITGKILRFLEKIDLRGYTLPVLYFSTILSIIGHTCAVLVIYLCSNLVESGLNLMEILAVAPIGLLANALPFTPGGLGIGEKGFDLLYKMIGGVQGGNSFLLTRVFIFAPSILGAAVAIFQFIKSHRKMPNEHGILDSNDIENFSRIEVK